MKKVFIVTIVLSVFLLSAIAFARPWGMTGANVNVTPEQQKFFDETKDLRKQMHDKRFELMELYRNPNADKAKVEELEKEIDGIRTKIQEKSKALGFQPGQGCGMMGKRGCSGPADCWQNKAGKGYGIMQSRMMSR